MVLSTFMPVVADGATVIISNSVSDHGRILTILEQAGLITLADDVDAINATVTNIKKQLVAGILSSYNEEIDSSKAIASATNAKNTLKGVIERLKHLLKSSY